MVPPKNVENTVDGACIQRECFKGVTRMTFIHPIRKRPLNERGLGVFGIYIIYGRQEGQRKKTSDIANDFL